MEVIKIVLKYYFMLVVKIGQIKLMSQRGKVAAIRTSYLIIIVVMVLMIELARPNKTSIILEFGMCEGGRLEAAMGRDPYGQIEMLNQQASALELGIQQGILDQRWISHLSRVRADQLDLEGYLIQKESRGEMILVSAE